MLAYFSAMDPISFKLSEFPLPPVFDALRLKAIETLEARDKELMKTLAATKSNIDSQAAKLSGANVKREDEMVHIKTLKDTLAKKRCVQQAKAEFESGEHIFTGGSWSKKQVTLKSPSKESWLGSVKHNCSINPEIETKKIVGDTLQLEIIPDFLAFRTQEVEKKKWNWFAQVWLEYDGEKFFAKEIVVLNMEKKEVKRVIIYLDAEVQNLSREMKETSAESHEIYSSLNEIHRVRDFLKRATFPLDDLQLLATAYPLTDISKLSTMLLIRGGSSSNSFCATDNSSIISADSDIKSQDGSVSSTSPAPALVPAKPSALAQFLQADIGSEGGCSSDISSPKLEPSDKHKEGRFVLSKLTDHCRDFLELNFSGCNVNNS